MVKMENLFATNMGLFFWSIDIKHTVEATEAFYDSIETQQTLNYSRIFCVIQRK